MNDKMKKVAILYIKTRERIYVERGFKKEPRDPSSAEIEATAFAYTAVSEKMQCAELSGEERLMLYRTIYNKAAKELGAPILPEPNELSSEERQATKDAYEETCQIITARLKEKARIQDGDSTKVLSNRTS